MKQLLISLLLLSTTMAHATTVTVTLRGIENPNGVVRIGLYNKKDGFTELDKAYRGNSVPIKADLSAYTSFSKLPEGYYAIAAFHDTNTNNKLDKNFLGIPKEKVFFSKNAKIKMGPPPFKEAAFYVGKETQTLLLHAQ
ncbi:MAG: DUF2141 domain-containing protein [bacterium]|nr:DUF2141 domain-containing protein [bacterium]